MPGNVSVCDGNGLLCVWPQLVYFFQPYSRWLFQCFLLRSDEMKARKLNFDLSVSPIKVIDPTRIAAPSLIPKIMKMLWKKGERILVSSF